MGVGVHLLGDSVNRSGTRNDTEAAFEANKAVDLTVNKQTIKYSTCTSMSCMARSKPDGTRAETRFRFSPKRTSPFKLAEESVHSTAGSRGVRISVSYAGCTTFRGSVRVLATHSIRQFPPSLPLLCVTVCHQVSNEL